MVKFYEYFEKMLRKLLIFSIIPLLFIFTPFAFAEKLGIECSPDSPMKNSNFEAIFECSKTLDVNKNVLETMFNDIRWISGIFDNAKLYDIKQNGSTGTATIEIPIFPSIALKSEIEFYKTNSNYNVEFINGKLQDSKIIIKTSETYGFDESEGMGSIVEIDFKMKKILCFDLLITQKCAKPNEIMFALDKGMYLMEPKAKLFQQQHPEYIKITSSNNESKNNQTMIEDKIDSSKFVSQEEITQISTSNQVNQIKKELEKIPTREYFKTLELPKPVSGRDSITLETDYSIFVFGSDVIITTKVQPIKNQPIKLDFYNSDNELSYSTSFSPSPDGINYKILNLGDEIPSRIFDDFTIYASYGDSSTSTKISTLRTGAVILNDLPEYYISEYYDTDIVLVTIVLPDLNLDPKKIETIGSKDYAKVTFSTNRGILTNYELVETNVDTGIFSGEFALVRDSLSSGNGPIGGKLSSYPQDQLQILLELPYMDVVSNTKINSPQSISKEKIISNGDMKLSITEISEEVFSHEQIFVQGKYYNSELNKGINNYAIYILDKTEKSLGYVKTQDGFFKFSFSAKEIFEKYGTNPEFFITAGHGINEIKIPIRLTIKNDSNDFNETMNKVPDWVKNNAKWWSDGQVDDSTFSQGIGFLIKEKVISVSSLPPQASDVAEEKIPDWIKNNAKWWADGMISEDDFLKGITYMVEKGIVKVQ